MATKRDIQLLNIVGYKVSQAKAKKRDIGIELSGGKPFYRKAINSQRNAGIATMFCGIFGVVILLTLSVFSAPPDSAIPGYLAISAIISALGIVMGTKTASLKVTPTAMLILTIMQLLYSLIMAVSVLPLIAVLLNVVALARWSTYKNWFYDIDIE